MTICRTLAITCPKDQLEGKGFAIVLSYMQCLAQYLAQVFADNLFSLINVYYEFNFPQNLKYLTKL